MIAKFRIGDKVRMLKLSTIEKRRWPTWDRGMMIPGDSGKITDIAETREVPDDGFGTTNVYAYEVDRNWYYRESWIELLPPKPLEVRLQEKIAYLWTKQRYYIENISNSS